MPPKMGPSRHIEGAGELLIECKPAQLLLSDRGVSSEVHPRFGLEDPGAVAQQELAEMTAVPPDEGSADRLGEIPECVGAGGGEGPPGLGQNFSLGPLTRFT